jgi:hypothetical protein
VAERPPLQPTQRFRLNRVIRLRFAARKHASDGAGPGRNFSQKSGLIPGKQRVSWKKGRPRKGDQRGTKPRSRPLAPIGGSSATHFRVITQCINETYRCFDSRFSMSELGQVGLTLSRVPFAIGTGLPVAWMKRSAIQEYAIRTLIRVSPSLSSPRAQLRLSRAHSRDPLASPRLQVSSSSPSGRRPLGRSGSAVPGRRR